jgi:Domain of unknown function (DUF4390)
LTCPTLPDARTPAGRALPARRASPGRAAAWVARWLRLLVLALWWPCLALANSPPALTFFDVSRDDDAVSLSYAVEFELPQAVDDALGKGIPIHFVAEANVYRNRWYWRDQRIAQASRSWRLAYQPLTSNYRVSFGGLSQTYPSRGEALAAVRRSVRWRIVDPGQIDAGSRHYLEFTFRLDTGQLPRPIQIGIGADWELVIERTHPFR